MVAASRAAAAAMEAEVKVEETTVAAAAVMVEEVKALAKRGKEGGALDDPTAGMAVRPEATSVATAVDR
jgi:hypothetical protein